MMRYEFFKILDQAFVPSLLEGNLYMNPLSFFRTLEKGGQDGGNKAQIDPMEGVCGTVSKNSLRQCGFHFSKEMLNAIGGNVTLISDNYGYNNLFCLYRLKIDDETKRIQKPDSRLANFNDKDKNPKVVVRITDTEQFLGQLEQAIQRALTEQNLEYAIYGGVVYGNAWISADGPGTRSAFHKDSSYAYQEEWRLCILRREWEDKAVSFPVGSLKNLCEIMPLTDFLDHLDQAYPGYTMVEQLEEHAPETYRTFSKINGVSRLMYAYMPQMPQKPTRSDQAEADWHYTQFLNLSGRQDQIGPYLEQQLYASKDLEHMELLVQYRLSQNQPEEAIRAFDDLLKCAPEQVKKEPDRFFFPLHSILMQFQGPEEAAKRLEIAVSQYHISKELEKRMQGDCLMALGFYDQAEECFKELQKEMDDPILEYNLAVSTFYLLRFEESARHLHTFMQYFSQSHKTARHVDALKKLLECFQNHTPLQKTAGEHGFTGLTWTAQTDDLLQQARDSGKPVCLGLDILYQLEDAQKWKLIDDIPSIMVVPLEIVTLVDQYQKTGDPVFYRIIRHLEQMERLKIKSPALKDYLDTDRRMPPYLRMECAMMR